MPWFLKMNCLINIFLCFMVHPYLGSWMDFLMHVAYPMFVVPLMGHIFCFPKCWINKLLQYLQIIFIDEKLQFNSFANNFWHWQVVLEHMLISSLWKNKWGPIQSVFYLWTISNTINFQSWLWWLKARKLKLIYSYMQAMQVKIIFYVISSWLMEIWIKSCLINKWILIRLVLKIFWDS